MLFRRWLAMALGVFWLTLWTHFLGAEGKKGGGGGHKYAPDYSEESSEWDWKMQQFKYLIDKGGRKAGCGMDTALIAILLFLPLIGLLGLIAPLMLFIFPLLLGSPTLVGAGGPGAEVAVGSVGRRKRSIDDVSQRVAHALNWTAGPLAS